jgi:hypothetical protein
VQIPREWFIDGLLPISHVGIMEQLIDLNLPLGMVLKACHAGAAINDGV